MPNIRIRDQYSSSVRYPFTPQPTIPQNIGDPFFNALRGLGAGVTALGTALESQKKSEDDFLLKKTYLEEATQAQFDLQDAMVKAPPGAPGFSQQQLEVFEKRHGEVIERLRAQGMTPDQLKELDLKFTGLRQTIVGNSLTFELGSRQAKVAADFTETGGNISEALLMNPDQLPGALEGLKEASEALPLPAEERQKLYDQQAAAAQYAAALGMARRNPQYVVDLFTPARAPDEQAFIGAMQAGIFSAESGHVVQPYTAVGPTVIRKGKEHHAYGKYQVMDYNVRNWTEQATGIPMSVDEFLHSPSAQEAVFADQMSRLYRKYNGNVRDAASVWFTGRTYDRAVAEGASDGYHTVQEYVEKVEKALGRDQGPIMAASGDIGDPVIDALPTEARVRMLNAAYTELGRQKTDRSAALELAVANAEAAALSGQDYEGNLPTREDFRAAYDSSIEADLKWTDFQGVLEQGERMKQFGTMSEGEISATVNSLRPTDTADPMFAANMANWERIAGAGAATIQQREADPVGYVAQHFPSVKGAYEAVLQNPADEATAKNYYGKLAAAYRDLGLTTSDWKAFQPNLLGRIKDHLADLTPTERVAKLGEMYSTMGDLFEPAMDELMDNGYAAEAYVAKQVSKDPALTNTYVMAMTGKDQYDADKSFGPTAARIDSAFRLTLGQGTLNYLNPVEVGGIKDLVIGMYIRLGGDAEADAPEQTEEWDQAVRRVLGGSGEPESGFFEGNDRFVEKMPNLTPGELWRPMRRNITIEDLRRLSDGGQPHYDLSVNLAATEEDIEHEGLFIWTGDDNYRILMTSDNEFLLNPDGSPFDFHLTRQDVTEIGSRTGPEGPPIGTNKLGERGRDSTFVSGATTRPQSRTREEPPVKAPGALNWQEALDFFAAGLDEQGVPDKEKKKLLDTFTKVNRHKYP